MKRRACLLFALALLAALPARAVVTDAFVERHADQLERLFAGLDPASPPLAHAISQWQAGHRRDAADALDGYFKARTFNVEALLLPPIPPDFLQQAEAALEDTFLILGRWESVPAGPDGGLDWEHAGERGDKETAWMLNRHAFLPVLAGAWHATGDERFRTRLNALWQDWIRASPYPGRLTFSAQWRPLEVARRILGAWTPAFFDPDLLNGETRLLVLASLLDHADALRHHASFWGGNHLITEKIALLAIAVAWPEFKDAADWRAYATGRVSGQLLAQTYPDGSYMELSNHYQAVVLENAARLLNLLAQVDPQWRDRPVAARITAMWDFLAGVTRPDGTGPLNNDSDLEFNAARLSAAAASLGRPDWLAIATHGAEGVLPEGPPSRCFPWAGQVILRSDWGPRADWIYFDAGPYGTAHQHVDRLHVSATLGGRNLLADTGRYTYRPGPWRDFFRGPDGHSVLQLDGRAAAQGPRRARAPVPLAYTETAAAVFAAAAARFEPAGRSGLLPRLQAPVPWTRAVLYDKRGFVIILDHLVAFSRHDLVANWQFHPDVAEADAPLLLRLADPPPGMRRTLRTGSTTPPLGGFHSDDYNHKVPSTLMSFSGSIDRPTTLAWVLQDEPRQPVTLVPAGEPGSPVFAFELVSGGATIAEGAVQFHPQPLLLRYTPR